MSISRIQLALLTFTAGALFAGTLIFVVAPERSSESPHAPGEDHEPLYTCGMHPQVIQKGPGDCPICRMKLTPMEQAQGMKGKSTAPCTADNALFWRAPMDPSFISDTPGKSPMGMALVPVCEIDSGGQVTVDAHIRQTIGVRSQRVQTGPLHRTIRTVARIEANERKKVVVTTKVAGWIDRLFVNETGQFVRRGQPLFSIYSPDVVAGQQEYLLALRQNSEVMVRTARDRLLFWDFTERQIKRIEERKTVSKAMTIFSPTTGYVVHKNAIEGAKVMPDKALFQIVDLSTVWVQADVYEYEVPWLEEGQEAQLSLSYIPGRVFAGKVSYIYPFLDEKSRTVRVRIEFDNPGLALKPGMFGTVRIKTSGRDSVTQVPSEAVIRTGRRDLVFIDLGRGNYRAQEIQLGAEGDDHMVEVLQGVQPGLRIVTSGQFLLDSESQLKEAVEKMLDAQKASPGPDDSETTPTSRPASQPAAVPASRPNAQPSSQPADGRGHAPSHRGGHE